MSESLHGPWRVKLVSGDPSPPTRMRISGSATADGRYALDFDHPLDLAVDGEEWSIELEFAPDAGMRPDEWVVTPFVRQTRFVLREGLIVDLISDKIRGVEFRPTLRLECTCLDRETNPLPADNPFDFTVADR